MNEQKMIEAVRAKTPKTKNIESEQRHVDDCIASKVGSKLLIIPRNFGDRIIAEYSDKDNYRMFEIARTYGVVE